MKKGIRVFAWSLLVAFILLNIFVFIAGKTFVYKTLVYTNPDIDDYKIFDNRTIHSGKAQPWPMCAGYNKQALPATLDSTLKSIHTTAFLVIRHDSILNEHYYEEFNEHTLANTFSVAKSVVNILCGIALKEGKIKSIDEPVGDFLPEFREGKKARITLRHLMTMSSGLNWDESYSSLLSPTTEAYYGKDLAKLVHKLEVAEEPGTICRYKSIDVQVLAMALQEAVHTTISEYASEKLWKPIGSEQNALWSLDHKDGMEKAYCCFNAEARDLARIGRLYLDSGRWNGLQIVPADHVVQSTRANGLKDDEGKVTDYYGQLWWLMDYHGKHAFYARGILGEYIVVIPAYDMVMVRLGKQRGPHHGQQFPELEQMLDAAVYFGGK